MAEPESTGNEKTDKARSTERNRQRMAAAQALIHCRTMARELRESEAQTHRIAEEKRQIVKKAKHELASLRRLHRQYPGEYDDPDAPAPSPQTHDQSGEGGRRSHSVGRMRGRSEPSDHQSTPPSGCSADPSPQPSPSRGEGAKPIPTDTGKSIAAQIVALAGTTQRLNTPP